MEINRKLIEHTEKVAANAWPAKNVVKLENWDIRENGGVTKRANSVFTIGDMPTEQGWLHTIEQFYQLHSLPSIFYMSACTSPLLAPVLLAQGYRRMGDLYVMAGMSSTILEKNVKNHYVTSQVLPNASMEWIENFLSLEGFPEHTYEAYHAIFSRIQMETAFISMYTKGQLVGVGTIAVENDWGYISNIVVDTKARRLGIASEMIRNLTRWANQHGAEKICLQVVKQNTPAIRLYEKLGFSAVSTSYFFIKEIAIE